MFFTSAAVLLIGMARWYFGMSSRRSAARSTTTDAKEKTSSRVSSVTSKMSSLLTGEPADSAEDDDAKKSPRRRHSIERPTRARQVRQAGRRHHPQPQNDQARHTVAIAAHPPAGDRDHRAGRRAPPSAPYAPAGEQPPPAEPPRRRSRTSSTREPRKAVPPADRRASSERPERRRRYDDYQPREPHVSNGNGTHHPVSRVRYRGGGEDIDDRAEYRSRPRSSRSSWEADSWEYDI